MIAKNNIFNIRTGAKWKGMTGATKGFVEFETREHGIRAWIVLMHNYRVKHRCATVRAMAKMETGTVLTAQEIYDVMQKFNVTFLSDKEINNLG
jgi:hypothetical protein